METPVCIPRQPPPFRQVIGPEMITFRHIPGPCPVGGLLRDDPSLDRIWPTPVMAICQESNTCRLVLDEWVV